MVHCRRRDTARQGALSRHLLRQAAGHRAGLRRAVQAVRRAHPDDTALHDSVLRGRVGDALRLRQAVAWRAHRTNGGNAVRRLLDRLCVGARAGTEYGLPDGAAIHSGGVLAAALARRRVWPSTHAAAERGLCACRRRGGWRRRAIQSERRVRLYILRAISAARLLLEERRRGDAATRGHGEGWTESRAS